MTYAFKKFPCVDIDQNWSFSFDYCLVSCSPCSVFHHVQKLFSSFWWSFYPLKIRRSSFQRLYIHPHSVVFLRFENHGWILIPSSWQSWQWICLRFPCVFTANWPQILGTLSRLILYHLINQPSIRDCGHQHDSAICGN